MFPGARSQRKNIKAIFIQNKDGERFKYPFIHTAGAFAMAQHVDHGGVPHDPAGKAIIGMSEEMAKLAEFKNKVRSASLHDDAHQITERAIGRLNELRAQIEALGKGHHYRAWAENFDEQQYMDDGLEMDEVAMEEYKQKFTQTSFQEELTGYFPLLHRIMKETNKLDLEEYVEEGQSRDEIGGAGVAYQAGYKDGLRAKSTGNHPEVNVASWGDHITDYRRGMHDAFNLPAKGPEDQFETWAEAIEQGELTDDQVDVMRDELDKLPKDPDGVPELELGPEGGTAWSFFNELGIEDEDLKDYFIKMAEIDDETNAVEVFQKWGQKNYPELLVALGMSAEEAPEEPAPEQPPAPPEGEPQPAPQQAAPQPTAENEDGKGIPVSMAKESMIKEIAKLVKSRYNEDNLMMGAFNGKPNIALEVKKEISEKFGDKYGEHAESLALEFMDRLEKRREEKHGPVGDDGLARLKELINNLKGKVESIGDRGTSSQDFNTNIMSREAVAGDDVWDQGDMIKKMSDKADTPSMIGKDVHDQGPMIKKMSKPENPLVKAFDKVIGHRESAELETIRKLSGLAK
jgi:hypothetical protein